MYAIISPRSTSSSSSAVCQLIMPEFPRLFTNHHRKKQHHHYHHQRHHRCRRRITQDTSRLEPPIQTVKTGMRWSTRGVVVIIAEIFIA